MITVGFLSLLKRAAARRGLDYDAGQVSQAEAVSMAEALNECARIAYNFYPWPQTSYRTTNGAGGWEPWDVLLAAYEENPITARSEGRSPLTAEVLVDGSGEETIVLTDGTVVSGRPASGQSLYYLFQKPPPIFSASAYSASTSYDTGDVCWSGNHCYRRNDSGSGTAPPNSEWVVQSLPEFLVQPVLAGVERWFARVDGLPVTARMLEQAMQDRLEDELRNLTYIQNQQRDGGPAHR